MPSPEDLKSAFYLSQIAIGAIFAGAIYYFWDRGPKSGFRDPEQKPDEENGGAKKSRSSRSQEDLLAQARMELKRPLQLSGIRLDGAPHEILGIQRDADEAQIQKAYRDLMKRYHPDKVGRPGSREWTDAQGIAEALNRAKDEMLRAVKLKTSAHSQRPKNSGR